MKIFYTDHFELPLPAKHRFPMSKYRMLRQRIALGDRHVGDTLLVPPAADFDSLRLCHTERYVDAVFQGGLSKEEIRRIGFPWSTKMVERSQRSVGATIAASTAALNERVAVNLAGGTHHAFADAGEGYCVFNDAAVAIRVLQQSKLIDRACIIDLDVHQGNGTAAIFCGDSSVFTLSIHGEKNFPIRKHPSDLDVELPDGTCDQDYLDQLDDALTQVSKAGAFDLGIYLAGADPYQNDRLGRLSLTKAGLAARDARVLRWCQEQRIPLAIAMAGGYAPQIDDIVDIHAATVRLASEYYIDDSGAL